MCRGGCTLAPGCRHRAEAVVGNTDWKRVEAELAMTGPDSAERGRLADRPRGQIPKISKDDSEAILKHIEDALFSKSDRN
jgi:hypothetical protein